MFVWAALKPKEEALGSILRKIERRMINLVT
jgi:hypothetical protein